MKRALLRIALSVLALTAAPALRADAPRVHALEGVRIVVSPGQVIDSGTVVIRDGIITAASATTDVPADAHRIDGEGLTVYAGLIEPYATQAWPDPPEGDDGEPQRPALAHDNATITPERSMAHQAFDSGDAQRFRQAGFTTALLVPSTGILRGSAALVNLGDGDAGSNLLAPDVAQAVGFDRAPQGYPSSLMGSVALLRQTLSDAAWYGKAQKAYAANPAQARPQRSAALAAMEPMMAGDQPVIVDGGNILGMLRGAKMARQWKLDAMLVGTGMEYQRLQTIRDLGLPLLLPVDFPDAPSLEADDEAADDPSVEIAALRHWDRAPENPVQVLKAEIQTAFTTHSLGKPADLWPNLAQAMERGLTADQALAGLTTTPAALLGLADRAGTVEAGKMANLLVVEGDLFVEKPKIRSVWVDGIEYKLGDIKPPEVDPQGTWAVSVNAGGQQMAVTLVIRGAIGDLSGTIGSPAGSLPLGSVEVSGKDLLVGFDSTPMGMPGEITIRMTLDGDSAKGSGNSPQGPFTLTARRTGPPEGEGGLQAQNDQEEGSR